MVVRNEAWVLRASIAAAQSWLNELIVLVHDSTDATEQIVRDSGATYSTINSPEWDEAIYRGILLESGRAAGGTHFAIIDADEVLTTAAAASIRDMAAQLSPGQLLRLPWIHCWRSLNQYRCDESPFGNARVPFLFRDDPSLNYAPDADGYQLHKRVPDGTSPVEIWRRDDGMGVLHLQHANWNRVVAKQKRYAEIEQRRWGYVRANYAGTTDETGLVTQPIPPEWWPVDPNLIDIS